MSDDTGRTRLLPRRGEILGALFWALLAAGAVHGLLLAAGKSFGFWFMLAAALVLAALILLVRSVDGEEKVPAPVASGAERLTGTKPFAEAGRWENRLAWTEDDAERFTVSVRPRLLALASERLRQRHGITPETHPHRAAAVLGGPLWMFLTRPAPMTPTPEQLDWLVARIEEI